MEFNENLTIEEWTEGNELAISIFNNKYKYGDETFMQTIDRISGGNEKIKQLILEKKFLPGGRICANRGLDHDGRKVSLSNCYVMTTPEDNLESIFDTAKELARTFSYGGGCGVDVSKLAYNGAKVNNAAKESSGAVSFMELYSMVTGLIAQRGRRGALMLSMDISHPDIEEFITVKNDLNKITKANISVKITDEFMQAVKDDKDYTLYFKREETNDECKKVVRARDLFRLICKNAWNMAEPGVLFWDRITNHNILSEDKKYVLAGTNPCVTGDTLILTDVGYYPIKDLVGVETTIWNGYEWSNVIPQITGLNQEILHIETSDGNYIDCTKYHKFILADGSEVEAKDLKIGDMLCDHEYPVIPGWIGIDEKIAYTKGFMAGDGCVDERGRKFIYLYGDKQKLYPYLEYEKFYDHTNDQNQNRIVLQVSKDSEWMNDKFWVPNESFDIRTRLNWLAGLIDSDGTCNDKYGAICISSINLPLLKTVKLMLTTLGVRSKIKLANASRMELMPDGKDGKKYYMRQNCYRLTISAYNVTNLIYLGFRTHRVPLIANVLKRGVERKISVTQCIPAGIVSEVFCVNEPLRHTACFNGLVTGNCSEIPLPSGGACLLGSLNLAEFVKLNSTKKENYFSFAEFESAVRVAVRELNVILDEGISMHPLQIQRDTAKKWRAIGLGLMGIADMLIKLGITYGSNESLNVCNIIGKNMAAVALDESAKLAEKYGKFPACNKKAILNSDFVKNNAQESTKKLIAKYGLRNGQLLTIAPTGSLSNVLGVSGGIEPIFATSYTRKTESLHNEEHYYKVYTPIVKEYLDSHEGSTEENLPKYFITSQDIPYENRIKMQAVWQNHIDNSISSTVNLPEETTVEQVEDLYMKAWENGLKGITVFRDNCARVGVLTTNKKEEEPEDDKTNNEIIAVEEETTGLARGEVQKITNNVIGLKRKLMTGCGSLHCVAMFDKDTGKMVETYLSKGSTGGCNNFMVGLSRMISLSARLGASIEDIIDQLKSTGSCPSYAVRKATHNDTSSGACCPMAVGNALIDMYQEYNHLGPYAESGNFLRLGSNLSKPLETMRKAITKGFTKETDDKVFKYLEESLCPQCGDKLEHEGGCDICKNCGWTRCD